MKTKITLIVLVVLFVTAVITAKNKSQVDASNNIKLKGNIIDEFSNESGSFTDNRDGKSYKWIKIGNQIWMAQNLAFNTYEDGCWLYDNDKKLGDFFGCLYDWNTAMKVAPKGWHLPTDSEWEQMINYLKENAYSYNGIKGDDAIAKSICLPKYWAKSTEIGSVGNNDYPKNINKTGFSALPAGCKDEIDGYMGIGIYAKWWTATDGDKLGAYCRTIYFKSKIVDRGSFFTNNKTTGYSIRCVKDQ
jgi:uncharacterized protein (TIGR02145 family)